MDRGSLGEIYGAVRAPQLHGAVWEGSQWTLWRFLRSCKGLRVVARWEEAGTRVASSSRRGALESALESADDGRRAGIAMELSSVLLARVLGQVETHDLNPRGETFGPDLIAGIAERFRFQKFPQKVEETDEQKGIE